MIRRTGRLLGVVLVVAGTLGVVGALGGPSGAATGRQVYPLDGCEVTTTGNFVPGGEVTIATTPACEGGGFSPGTGVTVTLSPAPNGTAAPAPAARPAGVVLVAARVGPGAVRVAAPTGVRRAGETMMLGTITAGPTGAVNGTVRIPAVTPTGDYVLTVSGPAAGGGTFTLTTAVVVSPPRPTSGRLPFTGSSTTPRVWIGVGAVLVGGALVVASRRRRSAA